MNRAQKMAWYQLCVVGVAAVVSVILMVHYVRKYQYGYLEAWWIAASYSTLCVLLTVLAPFIFRKKKGQIDLDERDLIIDRRAALVAGWAAYSFLPY